MSEAPIRIVYLIDKLKRAGAQVHLAQLACGLDRSRFAPEVLCLLEDGPLADTLRARGVPVSRLDLGTLYAPQGLVGLFSLARRFRARQVDILHTYLISANVYGTLAARLGGVPTVITTRRDMGFSRTWKLRILEEWLVNRMVDRVVAVSSAVANCARHERGIAKPGVATIENGVDIGEWSPARHSRDDARREWALAAEDPVVGVIATLSPVKGHDDFLRAAALVARQQPRARFFLVGDGPLRTTLEAQARVLGIADRVVFAGARDDVARLLAMLDVVVLPSQTEGMSNALLEAMAMARPVVATAVGGNPEVVRDGVTGLLVPPGDPETLARAIARLLERPEDARALGCSGRKRVEKDFTVQKMVARYEALYLSLASRAAAGREDGTAT